MEKDTKTIEVKPKTKPSEEKVETGFQVSIEKKNDSLKKSLSKKTFYLSQILILIFGLIFLAGLNYILNIQNQSEETKRPFLKGPVTSKSSALRLDLIQPEDDSLTFQSSVLVSGRALPNSTVIIFTDNEDLVVKAKTDGDFSTVLNLTPGVNIIKTVTFDNSGDVRQVERTIFYSKEKL